MKSILFKFFIVIISRFGILAVYSQSTNVIDDPEFDLALQWMHDNGLTKYSDAENYWPKAELTRQEAAKFFTEFSINVVDKSFSENATCAFDDIKDADPTLKEYVLESCTMGLFKGTNGKFFPFARLTKAEAITVLIRSIYGKLDESVVPWYLNYYEKATELGITKETSITAFESPISRYEIALMLYRAGEFNIVDDGVDLDANNVLSGSDLDNNGELDFLSGFDY